MKVAENYAEVINKTKGWSETLTKVRSALEAGDAGWSKRLVDHP